MRTVHSKNAPSVRRQNTDNHFLCFLELVSAGMEDVLKRLRIRGHKNLLLHKGKILQAMIHKEDTHAECPFCLDCRAVFLEPCEFEVPSLVLVHPNVDSMA